MGVVGLIRILISLASGVTAGVGCAFIYQAKNREGGFWWGFLLGWIGMLVVLLRRPLEKFSLELDRDEENLAALRLLREREILTEEEFEAKQRQALRQSLSPEKEALAPAVARRPIEQASAPAWETCSQCGFSCTGDYARARKICPKCKHPFSI